MRIFFILFILLFAGASQAAPDDLNEALRAAEAGDDAKAATLFLPLAAKGDPIAQYNLGVLYTRGLVIQKDYRVAVQWYLAAAGQGHAGAEANLALLYKNGEGVAQDYKKALHWSVLAARQGNSSAQLQTGEMHAAGLGVPQDYKEAIKWYRMAADQGNAPASAKLGECYEHGLGVAQDSAAAAKWYAAAANYAGDENSRNTYLARRNATEKNINSQHQAKVRVDAESAQSAADARMQAARAEAARAEQMAINRAAEDARLKIAAQAAFDAKVQAQKLADIEKELAKLKAEQSAKTERKGAETRRRSEFEIQMARRRAEINAEAERRRREILAADRQAKAENKAAAAKAEKEAAAAKAKLSAVQQPAKPTVAMREQASKAEPVKSAPAVAETGQRQVTGKITTSDKVKYPARTELTDEELKHPLIRELQPPAGSIPGKPLIKIKQIEWSKKQGES